MCKFVETTDVQPKLPTVTSVTLSPASDGEENLIWSINEMDKKSNTVVYHKVELYTVQVKSYIVTLFQSLFKKKKYLLSIRLGC